MAAWARDHRGRFAKKKPEPPAIAPELLAKVKEAAETRPFVINWATQRLELVVESITHGKPEKPWRVTRGEESDGAAPNVAESTESKAKESKHGQVE